MFGGHSYIGRLKTKEENVVRDMIICRFKSREILCVLKQQNPLNASTIEIIYNFKVKHSIMKKEGRTQMQQFFHVLDQKKYVEFRRRNETTEEVLDIFLLILIPLTGEMFSLCGDIGLHIQDKPSWFAVTRVVGVTSTSKTFIIAHAYL